MFSFLDSVDPFTVLLALAPLVAYLMVISGVRLSGRALVTSGGRDIAALALAISGFLAVRALAPRLFLSCGQPRSILRDAEVVTQRLAN